MILANISNGLVFQPYDDVCWFQSQHGHSAKIGYFKHNAMPWRVVIQILKGDAIIIQDATSGNKIMTDAIKYGVATWCLVFNRALDIYDQQVCSWQTKDMVRVSRSKIHKPYVQQIRHLIKLMDVKCKSVIMGKNVQWICLRHVDFDDKPDRIKEICNAHLLDFI